MPLFRTTSRTPLPEWPGSCMNVGTPQKTIAIKLRGWQFISCGPGLFPFLVHLASLVWPEESFDDFVVYFDWCWPQNWQLRHLSFTSWNKKNLRMRCFVFSKYILHMLCTQQENNTVHIPALFEGVPTALYGLQCAQKRVNIFCMHLGQKMTNF